MLDIALYVLLGIAISCGVQGLVGRHKSRHLRVKITTAPVVRCHECAYKERATVNEKGYLICLASGMEITDQDYCSYGERRGGL